jgi:hypothetical protein
VAAAGAFGTTGSESTSDRGRRHRTQQSAHRRRRRLLAIVLASAAIGAVPIVVETAGAAGLRSRTPLSPSSVATASPSPERRPGVAVIGDSLVFQTLTEQAAALGGRGFEPAVYGRPGVPLSDSWVQGYVAAVATDRTVNVVVLATASNDNLEASTRGSAVGPATAIAEYRARLEAAIDQLAGRCVVVVNVRSTSAALYAPETAPETNASIAAVAAAHPGQVIDVDWDSISRGHHDDWFVGDGLHFDDITSGADRHQAGADAYAEAIAAGVSRCTEAA